MCGIIKLMQRLDPGIPGFAVILYWVRTYSLRSTQCICTCTVFEDIYTVDSVVTWQVADAMLC